MHNPGETALSSPNNIMIDRMKLNWECIQGTLAGVEDNFGTNHTIIVKIVVFYYK